jgi:hypothetical protein
LIPILDTSPFELEDGIYIAFAGGAGTDFQLNDQFGFTAEFWTEVTYLPTAAKEYQVNYASGRITFYSADKGLVVKASYEGRGSCVDAEDINQLIDAFELGWKILSGVDTSLVDVGKWVGVVNPSGFEGSYDVARAAAPLRPAIGLCIVKDSAVGEILLEGVVSRTDFWPLWDLVPGNLVYIDAVTPGSGTVVKPSGSGQMVQVVGIVLADHNKLLVKPNLQYEINP